MQERQLPECPFRLRRHLYLVLQLYPLKLKKKHEYEATGRSNGSEMINSRQEDKMKEEQPQLTFTCSPFSPGIPLPPGLP